MSAPKYNHTSTEKKWQERWKKEKLYTLDVENAKNPFYNLWMFPYPSAEGLHAGHAFASTGSDVYGRFMRMNGYEVLQPIGYDSFGIHSENYAIKIGETPQIMIGRTTKHYEEQLRSLGHGYDWTRTVSTSDPVYYKWTQWLFTEMFKAGLAYKKKAQVNFCPSCKTVLADEQVMSPKAAGKEPKNALGEVVEDSDELKVCERCGTIAEKRDLDQWFLRITDYAERLLTGLGKIDWSERVKLAQKEWIGKSEGINFKHKVKGLDIKFEVYDSVPQTFLAQTFVVIAPEHPLVKKLVGGTEYEKPVMDFVKKIKQKKMKKGFDIEKETEGIFTGCYSENYMGTGRDLPIWIASFVIMDYGTGIVGCSAHDERDFAFAKKYNIPLKVVMLPPEKNLARQVQSFELCYHHDPGGIIQEPIELRGVKWIDAREPIIKYIEEHHLGQRTSNYHLRDWLVSRQRYWGAPIPMVHCKNCEEKGQGYLVSNKTYLHRDHSDWDYFGWWPEGNLPVTLPPMKEYKPDGSAHGPLHHHPEFYNVKCPYCGRSAERETDVMDTFVDSSWYFLRYPSVRAETSSRLPFDPIVSDKWLPVDLYFGGAEHSVLHLMYARFVNMVMFDKKLVKTEEPFPKFFAHGLMIKDGAKMSKSRGNVVNPDEYVTKFGADTLRLYVMFMGPMDGSPDFRDSGIEGMEKFTNRIWNLVNEPKNLKEEDKKEIYTKLHLTIKKITDDISVFKYNTAIASLMELVNTIVDKGSDRETLKILCQILAPFAPHMTEELWVEVLGQPFSIHTSTWPKYDAKYLKVDQITLIIQINGKIRGNITVKASQSESKNEIEELAKKEENVAKWLEGKEIKKTVFVPGKLVNFVI